MKKYLMTAMAAVAMGVAFTSCSHNTDLYGGEEGGGKINGRTVQEQIEDTIIFRLSFLVCAFRRDPFMDFLVQRLQLVNRQVIKPGIFIRSVFCGGDVCTGQNKAQDK